MSPSWCAKDQSLKFWQYRQYSMLQVLKRPYTELNKLLDHKIISLRFHSQLWTECQNNFDDVTVNLEMVYQYSSQAKRSNFKVGWDKKFDFEKITSSYVLIKKLQLFSEIKECTYCYNLNLTDNAASAKSTGVI